jgi:hypothetical protein
MQPALRIRPQPRYVACILIGGILLYPSKLSLFAQAAELKAATEASAIENQKHTELIRSQLVRLTEMFMPSISCCLSQFLFLFPSSPDIPTAAKPEGGGRGRGRFRPFIRLKRALKVRIPS